MSDLPLNIDVQQILLHFFNFAILFVGLYLILYKPVKDFMDNRTAKYNKDKEEAENLLNSAAEKEKLYQRRKLNQSLKMPVRKHLHLRKIS